MNPPSPGKSSLHSFFMSIWKKEKTDGLERDRFPKCGVNQAYNTKETCITFNRPSFDCCVMSISHSYLDCHIRFVVHLVHRCKIEEPPIFLEQHDDEHAP
ncbi:unnamed protein product [Musa acuminata var. zebrina]